MSIAMEPAMIAGDVNLVHNHVCARVSALDMEMIRAIPPGGNWRDIPLSTVNKSARLKQIRQSGGRTTYYGRLRDDLPSYTISTYFNRPGNGTFIHPTQNRLISQREAARLQSFSDSYRFVGSVSSIFKQVGNAVPPLLACAVGALFKPGKSVDLFAGAGGLSEGLRLSGHNVLAAAEINPNMCATYSLNHPDSEVMQVDIANDQGCEKLTSCLENALSGKTLHLLAAGPPCQGFSTAGKWTHLDPRNALIFETLKLVERFQPENVLFENVPGIVSMLSGSVLQRVLDKLASLEYKSEWFALRAEQYCVPQRRRRIFIVASRNGVEPKRPEALLSCVSEAGASGPDQSADALPSPVTVGEAISDLPPIPSGVGAGVCRYDSDRTSFDYQRMMRGLLSLEEFLRYRHKQD